LAETSDWRLRESRILVKGLCLAVHIGVGEAERAHPQRLLVDIELEVEPEFARDDEVASVVDYGPIVQRVRGLAERRAQLLETWVKWVAEICFIDPRVRAATVTLVKPDIFGEGIEVGVRQRISRVE